MILQRVSNMQTPRMCKIVTVNSLLSFVYMRSAGKNQKHPPVCTRIQQSHLCGFQASSHSVMMYTQLRRPSHSIQVLLTRLAWRLLRKRLMMRRTCSWCFKMASS